jgi:hypothetical protein
MDNCLGNPGRVPEPSREGASPAKPAAPHASGLSVLTRLQLGLEALYRVETRLEIEAFVINEAQRGAVGPQRTPREQLLLQEEDDEMAMALFVDAGALANLERHDPAVGLHDGNFADFCLAVEGVSHFVYVALCAAGHRSVSPLELELQAEVDKFACCVLLAGADPSLRTRLYGAVRFADDLDGVERERYRTANNEANRYAIALERLFVARQRTGPMLEELRRFYRMDLPDKLGRIAGLQ